MKQVMMGQEKYLRAKIDNFHKQKPRAIWSMGRAEFKHPLRIEGGAAAPRIKDGMLKRQSV
jgi:hypothetical protein